MAKRRVLVIEDEPDILEILGILLRERGFETLLADDGDEGVEMARRLKPDLIILDLILPSLDGFEVCEMIRNDTETQDIPILILSARESGVDVEKAFCAGANDFALKPFRNAPLITRVCEMTKTKAPSMRRFAWPIA